MNSRILNLVFHVKYLLNLNAIKINQFRDESTNSHIIGSRDFVILKLHTIKNNLTQNKLPVQKLRWPNKYKKIMNQEERARWHIIKKKKKTYHHPVSRYFYNSVNSIDVLFSSMCFFCRGATGPELKTHFVGQFSQFHGLVSFPPLRPDLNYNFIIYIIIAHRNWPESRRCSRQHHQQTVQKKMRRMKTL